MSEKTTKKIGFFSALSICVGSFVGIGIFLKNGSVGESVKGNGVTWLLTWIVSGLIALLVAIHFGKISKVESDNEVTGLSAWSRLLTTQKQKWFHKIVSFNYALFYLAILGITLAFFSSELLIAFLKEINPNITVPIWGHVLIALVFLTIFILTNHFSYKVSGWISSGTLVLKFIPLIMVVIIGIALVNNHNGIEIQKEVNGAIVTETINGQNGFTDPKLTGIDAGTAIKGMMISLPSVLFAFDSFVGVGALSNKIKGGDKAVSKIIIFGMLFVTIIYSLISLASAFHFFDGGKTTVVNVLKDALPKEAAQAISTFVSFFLFISAYGTSNSIIGVGVHEFENVCYETRVIYSKKLLDRFGRKKGGLIINGVVSLFWAIVMFIPSIILNTDSLIDGFSNLVVVYFFMVYTLTIYMFWKNKYLVDPKFQENSNKVRYSILVWVSISTVFLAIGLNLFFLFFNAVNEIDHKSSWGLYEDGKGLTNLDALIIYLVMTPAFFSLPFLNYFLNRNHNNF